MFLILILLVSVKWGHHISVLMRSYLYKNVVGGSLERTIIKLLVQTLPHSAEHILAIFFKAINANAFDVIFKKLMFLNQELFSSIGR